MLNKYLYIAFILLSVFFCLSTSSCGKKCEYGTVNGYKLQRGSNGGCYYINGSGNKIYVDRSQCTCK